VQVLTAPPPADADTDPAPPVNGGEWTGGGRVPAELASPSYAALVARVADLEHRLAASLERRAAPVADWGTPPFPPPPPPPVEVGRVAPQLALTTDDRRDHRPLAADDHRPAADVRRGRAAPARPLPDLDELAERLSDIERRLARIEAELGALR